MKKLLAAFALIICSSLILFSFNNTKKTVIIDAGHGGTDNGASYDGVYEKAIALDIAKKVKALNKNENLEIVLTRDADSYPSLSERSSFINKLNPAMVISLHINRTQEKNTEKSGTEVYYSDQNEKPEASKILAEKLSSKFDQSVVKNQNLHILRNSKSPALLLEMGFINNKKERELLNSNEGQNQFAEKILEFINEN